MKMHLTLKAVKSALAPKGFSVRRNYYSGEYTLYPRGGKLVHGERAFTYESACLSDILKTAQNIENARLTPIVNESAL